MSEPNTPPPPPTSQPASADGKSTNTVMLVLSYVWLLALIPLLVEKDDKEIQWHAKHGLVILAVEMLVWVVLTIIGMSGILACVAGIFTMFIWLGFVIVRVICIVKAVNGQRFLLPGISQYADKF
jgi:uncharacterized membrane protein